MPTYEFRCPRGHEFERFFKTMSSSPTELPCPECGAVAARQLSGGGGLVFKGSGFYLTDYGKNAHRGTDPSKKADKGESTPASATAEASKSDGSSPKGEAKGESKSETKRESQKSDAPPPSSKAKPKSE